MIKKLPWFILCAASVLLFGCTVKQNIAQPDPQPAIAQPTVSLSGTQSSTAYNMPRFQSISIAGPYVLNYQTNSNTYLNPTGLAAVSVAGDSRIVDHTQVLVKNDTLFVFLNPDYQCDPSAGRATVTVQTTAPLRRAFFGGNTSANLQNIYGDRLSVLVEGSAYVALSGQVNRLDATAIDNSRLNAKCLVSQAAFVNTTDTAQAEILGGPGISGLAAKQSDIYYYTNPQMIAPYQRQSGSVMSMVGVAPASISIMNEDTGIPADSTDFGIK
ncbi:MAG: DUF2807 domain-containing protein [Gammaproteobacteria bacterium]|nr:DUF2807 domain-containing protein [Gammaproteobacteria bacterium]